MSQSGYTPIQLYYSPTASAVPVNTNLANGELALNTNDGKLFYKDSSGVVQVIASKAAAAGVLSFSAGSTGLTPSTATSGAVTLAGTLGISNGGTGITSFGTGVQTALGVNVGTAGSFLVNGGVLGTPSSGTVTNLTGTASININGTVGATTASTGAFTTLSASSQLTLTNASNYNLYASGAGANFMQGSLGLGGLANAYDKLLISGTLPTGSSVARAIEVTATVPSGATGQGLGFLTALSTQAASFALTNMQHYVATQGTIGSGSSITNQFGFSADSSLTGATNNYGFFSDIASGTNRYNFYANGTAANYFAGNVGIGTTSAGGKLDVNGRVRLSGGEDYQLEWVNNSQTWRMNNSAAGRLYIYDVTNTKFPFGIAANAPNDSLSIGSTGIVSIAGAAGSESLRVTPVASAVNYWNAQGNATGAGVQLLAQGSDANISAYYAVKGSGSHVFWDNVGATQFVVARTASAVDYLQVTGSASGFPQFTAQGASANVSIVYTTKGAGGHSFNTGASNLQFNIANTASAVNYLQVTGAVTSQGPTLSAQGSDTNIGLNYSSKGTGTQIFYVGSYAALRLDGGAVTQQNTLQLYSGSSSYTQTYIGADTNINANYVSKGTGYHGFFTGGGTQFLVNNTASSVNYLQVTGAATLGAPTLSAQGSDANINALYLTKGTGTHYIGSNSNGYQFTIATTASAVNQLQATGGATGSGVTLSAQGSDTNIDLALTPKGTGVLSFGTYTAGTVVQAGYITIKDAGGTTRRLLVG